VTPFETLVCVRQQLERTVPILTAVSDPPVLPLCAACTEALLAEMAGLFPAVPEGHPLTLEGSTLVGFTFTPGTPDACGLCLARQTRGVS
jgi:hypothetical protein